QGIQSLTDLYFTIKSANTKKGSAEEEAAARKQFNINKGLQIASTTITGIQNGIKAFGAGVAAATQIGYPLAAPAFGAAYAAISAIGTIAAIAKISSTQFGSTGGGGASAGATTPSVPTPNAPVQNQAQPARLNDFSLGIAGNSNNASAAKSTEVRAVVLESDITKTQKKVEGYKLNSEL
ncbi:MAG: hypothetical protein ABIP51_16000, partial [Bacteroidia bacterium]